MKPQGPVTVFIKVMARIETMNVGSNAKTRNKLEKAFQEYLRQHPNISTSNKTVWLAGHNNSAFNATITFDAFHCAPQLLRNGLIQGVLLQIHAISGV